MKPPERDLTTGEVGKLLGYSTQEIGYFVDSGKLKGYHVPDSTHRRITPGALLAFVHSLEWNTLEGDTEEFMERLEAKLKNLEEA